MASPTLDLLCCSYMTFSSANTTNKTDPCENSKCHHQVNTYFYLYNGIVITMSTFSVLGSLYVLFPRRRDTSNLDSAIRPGLMEIRQRWILSWLFFANIMACLGLIVLSGESFHILEVLGTCLTNKITSKSWEWPWPCVPAAAWINFFFLATYFWITCYTIDVYLFLKKSTVKHILRVYLVVSWLFPITFVSVGLWAVIKNTKQEKGCSACSEDKTLLKVYYLCSFIPMMLALIANPVLSFLVVRKVSPLMRGRGMYTDREREVERQVKRKFLKIVIVLEICWFPNVINGILLLSEKSVEEFYVVHAIIWIFMAILNPLQAFLNTLVYWGPTGYCSLSFCRHREEAEDTPSGYLHSFSPLRGAAIPLDTETTPLVRGGARDALN